MAESAKNVLPTNSRSTGRSVRQSSGTSAARNLPTHVGEAPDGRREVEREHVVAPVGAEQLGAQDGGEDRHGEPDLGQVLAVRDQLGEAVGEALPDDRADRQHRERRQERDQRQRDRQELRAPALARAERAERAPARQRDDREPGRPAHAVVARVAGVLESRAHAIAPITASSSVRSPGSSARRLTPASAQASRTASGSIAGSPCTAQPALLAVLDAARRAR